MKVGGSYDSVVLGVSEQKAHERRPGQHEAQTNLISDPVRGLARRHGSVWVDEVLLPGASLDALGTDASAMREFEFKVDGVDYTLLYRPEASANGKDTFLFLFNKTTGEFIPVVYENSTWVNNLIAGGVSAVACVGRYLYLAGHLNVPTYTAVDEWSNTANLSRLAAWVRGGAYSRKYTLTLTRHDGTTLSVDYKTKPSAYPELNDTSDIPFYKPDGTTADPEYQKKLNDRVNLYNSKVTAYITEAAEDIAGENIAQKLVDKLVALGVAATRVKSTVVVEDTDFKEITADDGGDDTLFRSVGMELSSPTLVSTVHYVGKVVRIRPQGSSDKESYYLRAYPKDGSATGWTEVEWREAAGVVQTPLTMLSQLVIHDGTAYVARDGAGLLALAPASGPHVAYAPSTVGDGVSSPAPAFFGQKITMLTVFQDRLLVGSNGTVNASRPGDYLNFFRQTVINVQDNDPIEMYSYGSEGDVLREAVMFDKELVLFGDTNQYTITGRQVLSAKSPNIQTLSAHDGALLPVGSGNFVFYAKRNEGRTSVHQLFVGQLREAPESTEITQQLGGYLDGSPTQLLATTSPNSLLFRTREFAHGFYHYVYVDSPNERLMDSWSAMQYHPALGRVCGLSEYKGDVYVFTMRAGNGGVYVVADRQSLRTDLSQRPYADSLRKYTGLSGWHAGASVAQHLVAAVDDTSSYFMLGGPLSQATSMVAQLPGVSPAMWVGATCDAEVTPTNPYYRDQNGKAILSGRMVLSQVRPSVTDTGGLNAVVEALSGQTAKVAFEGRLLGRSSVLGTQPLATTQLVFGVGREVRECRYTLRSEKWLPMTITSIEWTGQFFNRVRRAG